ncbi:MAG: A/G-specific adenine glycosylase [Candidatus Omnitrophica bacterium]|nr:A/G-specific adenine glycosylase [Candidatus Omnitrophota bacterium]
MPEKKKPSGYSLTRFKKIIHGFYLKEGRSFPWRDTRDPYRILVSEMMLQQTQVERVLEKYSPFLKEFPDIRTLARGSLNKVLLLWQGLGYNRRALALYRSAQKAVKEYHGTLPADITLLREFPGIGQSTAGALCAFAFDLPVIFIETNIRRVFIHFFFSQARSVRDEELIPLIEATLDKKNPRDWYYALMDYGTMLKKTRDNPNLRSAHYRVQSRFAGSNREIRGAILRLITASGPRSKQEILKDTGFDHERIEKSITSLIKEGFLVKKNNWVYIGK